jgi:uncharacterized membrane protein YraQ (UPF0718 family)
MQEILNLIHEMSPYLLLGFGMAGVMHTFVPTRLYHRYLSGRGEQKETILRGCFFDLTCFMSII